MTTSNQKYLLNGLTFVPGEIFNLSSTSLFVVEIPEGVQLFSGEVALKLGDQITAGALYRIAQNDSNPAHSQIQTLGFQTSEGDTYKINNLILPIENSAAIIGTRAVVYPDKVIYIREFDYWSNGVQGHGYVANTEGEHKGLIVALPGSNSYGYGATDLIYETYGAEYQKLWPLELLKEHGGAFVALDGPKFGKNQYAYTTPLDSLIMDSGGVEVAEAILSILGFDEIGANKFLAGVSWGGIRAGFLALTSTDYQASYISNSHLLDYGAAYANPSTLFQNLSFSNYLETLYGNIRVQFGDADYILNIDRVGVVSLLDRWSSSEEIGSGYIISDDLGHEIDLPDLTAFYLNWLANSEPSLSNQVAGSVNLSGSELLNLPYHISSDSVVFSSLAGPGALAFSRIQLEAEGSLTSLRIDITDNQHIDIYRHYSQDINHRIENIIFANGEQYSLARNISAGGSGNDILVGREGETFFWGDSGNDHLVWKGGDAEIYGVKGNDTYVIDGQHGHVHVNEWLGDADETSLDVIRLSNVTDLGDVRFERVQLINESAATSLRMDLSSGATVDIYNQFISPSHRVEVLELADGTRYRLDLGTQGAIGDDILLAEQGGSILDASAGGRDYLFGSTGSDIYLVGGAGVVNIIEPSSNSSLNDVLHINDVLSLDELQFDFFGEIDEHLRIKNSDSSLEIIIYSQQQETNRVEFISFADALYTLPWQPPIATSYDLFGL